MGSLTKKLGQLAAKSLESESSRIIRTIKPNKIPNSLSQKLDTTLKDSHDMRVFGMGTLASMANRDRYLRFTTSLYGIYSTMERELDKCCGRRDGVNSHNSGDGQIDLSKSPVAHFWNEHSETLRRSDLLLHDLTKVSSQTTNGSSFDIEALLRRQYDNNDDDDDESSSVYSPATREYVTAIRKAGDIDRERGGTSARLLGHAYTRYLADLMGGAVLASPTRLALRLEEGVPAQYTFRFPSVETKSGGGGRNRMDYVESIYSDLNCAGEILKRNYCVEVDGGSAVGDDVDGGVLVLEEVVEEARVAFRHNVKVYAEEPIVVDSAVGLKNIVSGWVLHR